jgi:hypothetical protein
MFDARVVCWEVVVWARLPNSSRKEYLLILPHLLNIVQQI